MGKQYLDVLTWLRAIAAFFVVVSHVLRTSEVSYIGSDGNSFFLPLNLIDLGSFGVTLFFALSGTTLYISNAKGLNTFSSYPSFIIKRTFRIWPAFFISFLIYIVFIEIFELLYFSDRKFWIAQFLKEYRFTDIVTYLGMISNITGPSGLFISPYWSLPVEYQYYLMLPIIIILMNRFKYSFIPPLLIGIILYACYKFNLVDINRMEVFQLGFVFFGGVLVAKYYTLITIRIPFLVSLILFIIMTVILGMLKNDYIVIPSSIPFLSTKWNIFGLCSIFSVLLALITKVPNKSNFLMHLAHQYGTVSYSIYLFHMLFLGIATLFVINTGFFTSGTKLLFIFLFTLVGSYYFSLVSYRFIELPSISLGRKLSKMFSG